MARHSLCCKQDPKNLSPSRMETCSTLSVITPAPPPANVSNLPYGLKHPIISLTLSLITSESIIPLTVLPSSSFPAILPWSSSHLAHLHPTLTIQLYPTPLACSPNWLITNNPLFTIPKPVPSNHLSWTLLKPLTSLPPDHLCPSSQRRI